MSNAREQLKKMQNQYSSGSADWFKLENDGDNAEVTMLISDDNDLLSVSIPVHEIEVAPGKKIKVRCTEETTCPLCNAGNRPNLKVFVYLVDHRDGKVKVFERPNGFIGELLTLMDEYGDLNNRRYKIVRNGKKGDTKTRYTMMPKDKDEAAIATLPNRPDPYAGLVKRMSAEAITEAMASGNWGGGKPAGGEGKDAPAVEGGSANGKRLKFN